MWEPVRDHARTRSFRWVRYLEVRHAGYVALGGASRSDRSDGLALTVDTQYTHIPGILGTGGVSRDANEDDLGGLALRFRVVLGR